MTRYEALFPNKFCFWTQSNLSQRDKRAS